MHPKWNVKDPCTLPDWPHPDLEAEHKAFLSCLLGQHGEKPLTGPFGHAVLFREILRHDVELIEALAKLRTTPDNDNWRDDPERSVIFEGLRGHVALMSGFPELPTLSLEQKYLDELEALFTPGQPAFKFANIELAVARGDLKRFAQLDQWAQEARRFKKLEDPFVRFGQAAILPIDEEAPEKRKYIFIGEADANRGVEAIMRDFQKALEAQLKLFPKLGTSAIPPTLKGYSWLDSRAHLSDLMVMRLIILHGYPGARQWTREKRPHKGIMALKDSDYAKYYVEKKLKARQPRPIYERIREYENAVGRALIDIASVRKL